MKITNPISILIVQVHCFASAVNTSQGLRISIYYTIMFNVSLHMVNTRYFCRFENKNIIYSYVKLEEFEDTNHNPYIEEEQTTQWFKRKSTKVAKLN